MPNNILLKSWVIILLNSIYFCKNHCFIYIFLPNVYILECIFYNCFIKLTNFYVPCFSVKLSTIMKILLLFLWFAFVKYVYNYYYIKIIIIINNYKKIIAIIIKQKYKIW